MKDVFALLIILALCGCSTTGGSAQSTNTYPMYEAPSGSIVRAVCSGLTNFDSSASDYNGADGSCPGTDVDAKRVYNSLEHAERRTLMLNKQVKKAALKAAIISASKGLTTNDLIVIAHSGHGTKTKDLNGDEADGYDEGICLDDCIMWDDEFMAMLDEDVDACRILLLTDTCLSQGNFRMFKKAVNVLTFGTTFKPDRQPFLLNDDNPKQLEFGFMKKGPGFIERGGQIIQIAMCAEDSYSYGDENGGVGTTTLYKTDPETVSLLKWFDLLASRMPKNQTPQWVEDGDVNDSFRYVRALH